MKEPVYRRGFGWGGSRKAGNAKGGGNRGSSRRGSSTRGYPSSIASVRRGPVIEMSLFVFGTDDEN